MKMNKIVSRFVLTFALAFIFFISTGPVESKAKECVKDGIIDLEVTETVNDDNSSTGDTETPVADNSNSEADRLQDINNGLLPDVDAEGFFAKIYNKLFSACTAAQKIVGVILIGFFILGLIMIAVSLIFTKKNVMWYVWATFIIAILFFCDIYAVQIISAISNWLVG